MTPSVALAWPLLFLLSLMRAFLSQLALRFLLPPWFELECFLLVRRWLLRASLLPCVSCVALPVGSQVVSSFAPLASLRCAPLEVPLPPSERGFALLSLTGLVAAQSLMVLQSLAPLEVRA